MKSILISYRAIYTILLIFFRIFFTSAQEEFEIENFLFDSNEYKLVKSSNDRILLLGKKNYVDVFQNKIIPYSNLLDSLFLDTEFKYFNYVNIDDKIHLINPGGGYVLEFDYKSLKRIDNSSNLRAYYQSETFSYKGDIYQFGGYGFFKYNAQLLKFDFRIRDWILVDLILDQNFGFVDPLVLVYQNKLLIYSEKVINNFFGQKQSNPFVYSYDLDSKEIDKIKFDYKKFDFLSGDPMFKISNRFTFKGLFYIPNYSNPKELYSFDFINNQHQINTLSAPIVSEGNVEILEDQLYYISKVQSTNLSYLAKSSILNTTDMGSIRSAFYLIYVIVALLFCISFYLFRIKRVFLLEGKNLKRGLKKVRLDYDQVYFLTKLGEEKTVNNADLIRYFDRDSKSYDLNIKRKNNMISTLEFKIESEFKTHLFEKVTSPIDKRQGIYILKKKLTLADKKS